MRGSDYSLLVSKGISPAVWRVTPIAMLWQREQHADVADARVVIESYQLRCDVQRDRYGRSNDGVF
jgi:hypothetical protein